MLASDSPLRRLPPQINRKQALFLDGIRHAAELADFAYSGLRESLTTLAFRHHDGTVSGSYTEPFLYAWAVVDAIDRLRGLLLLLPGATQAIPPDGELGFRDATQPIRNVRNVSDHLAERADYVVARNGTALGLLSWFTIVDDSHGLACAIVPGTISSGTVALPNPIGKLVTPPTDLVTLSAGEHIADLSDSVRRVHRVIAQLEDSLSKWMRNNDLDGVQAGADVLICVTMAFGS